MRISGKNANALPRPDFADIDVVRSWIGDEEIRGVILTGEGRHFCSGADIEQFKSIEINKNPEQNVKKFEAGRKILSYIENLEKPVIASIDGACIGGGLEIALACHLRYCSSNAIFGFTEINHGIIPMLGGIERLAAITGKSKAFELLLSADTFNAEYALETGIVNSIAKSKSALDHSLSIMTNIISKKSKPVMYAMRLVKNVGNAEFEADMNYECRMFAELVIDEYGNSAEAQNG